MYKKGPFLLEFVSNERKNWEEWDSQNCECPLKTASARNFLSNADMSMTMRRDDALNIAVFENQTVLKQADKLSRHHPEFQRVC